MVGSPTLHICAQRDLHIPPSTAAAAAASTSSGSAPSPASSADLSALTEPSVPTISQGPLPSQISRFKVPAPPSFSTTPATTTSFQRHRSSSSSITSFPESLFFRATSISSPCPARKGKSETHLHSLIESSAIYPNTKINMLATEGTPTTCFALTSPLLPPSLANTSASAPPPSSSSNSRKKPKTRLNLNSLPRFSQPPSHSSQSHMATGHYQYTVQQGYQYSQHTYAQQQANYLSAQQQLQLHQKDLIQQATRGSLPSHILFPSSPRLIPMGSPGPVTPLTLEEAQGGYLFAGSPSNSSGMPFMQQREMDKLNAIAAAQN